MALTKSSVLHYWSSRYGINPRVGGRPVFTRNSAGLFVTQEGEVNTAIVNTPRFDWAAVSGERRKVLTLEMAKTNSVLWSRDLTNAAWATVGTGTAVLNAIGVDGTPNTGTTLTDTDAAAYYEKRQTFTVANDSGTHVARFWIAKDSVTTRFPLVQIALTGGTAKDSQYQLNTSTGTIVQVVAGGASARVYDEGTFWRVELGITNNTTGNTSLVVHVYPAAGTVFGTSSAATTGSCVVGAIQAELNVVGIFGTSPIHTTSAAATRATDSCGWNFPPLPQAMMVYVRFIERGTLLEGGRAFAVDILTSDLTPKLLLYSTGGFYNAYHHNGTGAVVQPANVAPAIGDTVELVLTLAASGAVRLIQSINGAAVYDAGTSATLALAAAWSGPSTQLNSAGNWGQGAGGYAECKIVKFADVVASTAQGIMDELRSLELGPNGDLL